jgi:hypothetical protein
MVTVHRDIDGAEKETLGSNDEGSLVLENVFIFHKVATPDRVRDGDPAEFRLCRVIKT